MVKKFPKLHYPLVYMGLQNSGHSTCHRIHNNLQNHDPPKFSWKHSSFVLMGVLNLPK